MNFPPRNHNGDPYWSRVIEVRETFRGPLRNIARGKKWEAAAAGFDLTEMAQAFMIIETALRPTKETAEQKAVRLSARAHERALVNLRAAIMRKNAPLGSSHHLRPLLAQIPILYAPVRH
jgi:hypothetical protein